MIWELSPTIHMPFAVQARHFLYLSSSRKVFCSSNYSRRPNFRSNTDLEQMGTLFSAFHIHFLNKFCNYGSYFSLLHMPFTLHSMFYVELRLLLHEIGYVESVWDWDPLLYGSTLFTPVRF